MELHKALRNIIKTDGPEILRDIRLVNILDDFNAYQDIPASKYILRAIIVDGFSSKLMAIGKWDNTAEALAIKFANITGFIPESVSLIFQAIAFGLGWIKEFTPVSTANPNTTSSQGNTTNPNIQNNPKGWRKGMSEDELERFVFSLIDFDHSREKVLKVHWENASIEVDSDKHLSFSFELVRDAKKAYGYLRYAVYDLRNKIKGTGTLGYLFDDDINHKPVVGYINELTINKIGKIRLFWDD